MWFASKTLKFKNGNVFQSRVFASIIHKYISHPIVRHRIEGAILYAVA